MTNELRTTIRRITPGKHMLAVGAVAVLMIVAGCSGGGDTTTSGGLNANTSSGGVAPTSEQTSTMGANTSTTMMAGNNSTSMMGGNNSTTGMMGGNNSSMMGGNNGTTGMMGGNNSSMMAGNNSTTNGSQKYAVNVSVRDDAGAPVANATVQVSSESGGILSGIFGDNVEDPGAVSAQGNVSAQLSNGNYTVSAQADGFEDNQTNLSVNGGDQNLTVVLNQSSATTAPGGMGNNSSGNMSGATQTTA